MFAAKIDVLGIISGALGAYRFDAIRRMHGWDVGPGEDGDLTLRLRKAGYRIAYQPYAQCMTNLPTRWMQLIRQRRRWQWAVITFECRKHIDLASLWSRNFRISNLVLLVDRWLYDLILLYASWIFVVWWAFHWHAGAWLLVAYYYALYLTAELIQFGLVMYYSTNRRRDLLVGAALPLMPIYYLLQKAISLWAVTEEIFTRRSFRDGFVPQHVRERTWHW
jgi:cellulose synthase/poly-beta-1,6-N-acetylglucosamine synthase-like glycosyltransferase